MSHTHTLIQICYIMSYNNYEIMHQKAVCVYYTCQFIDLMNTNSIIYKFIYSQTIITSLYQTN